MTDKYAKLRELAEKATPGPWTWGQKYVAKATGTGCYHSVAMAPSGDTEPEGSQWEHDAAFIAAANPQTVLALLDHLAAEKARADAAERERDKAREAHKVIADMTRNCHHDGGYDRDFGPVGCMLGDKCVCIGLHPVAVAALSDANAAEREA